MTYLNFYQHPTSNLPKDIHLNTPPDQYDFNYVFEVKKLKSDRVELRPLVVRPAPLSISRTNSMLNTIYQPSLHAQLIYDGVTKYPEVLRWLGVKPFEDLGDVLVWIETTCRTPSVSINWRLFSRESLTRSQGLSIFCHLLGTTQVTERKSCSGRLRICRHHRDD